MPRTPAAILLLLCWCLPAAAADDSRVSFLEQEVRNLQRQVMTLSRRVDNLDSRPSRPEARVRPALPETAAPSTRWIDAAKWKQVRAGMSELAVIELLGPPTSMRDENGTRVLLYAMELSGGFLGGSIRVRERVVADVQIPMLQ
jgi:hypothetical protein